MTRASIWRRMSTAGASSRYWRSSGLNFCDWSYDSLAPTCSFPFRTIDRHQVALFQATDSLAERGLGLWNSTGNISSCAHASLSKASYRSISWAESTWLDMLGFATLTRCRLSCVRIIFRCRLDSSSIAMHFLSVSSHKICRCVFELISSFFASEDWNAARRRFI